MAIDRMKMSDKHEGYVAKLLKGRRSKASGSTPADQGDGRHDHTEEPYAFAWDCKATLAKSHTVTLEMLDKLEEQSQGERPALPLRWYADESLKTYRDWILVKLDDAAEVVQAATTGYWAERSRDIELEAYRAEVTRLTEALESAAQSDVAADLKDDEIEAMQQEIAVLQAENTGLSHRAKLADDRAADAEARARAASAPHAPSAFQPSPVSPPPMNLSPLVPMLPWTSVFVTHQDGVQRRNGVRYSADGSSTFFDVISVRVEPYNESVRLFVNEQIVRHGDLWIDGQLDTRVGHA